MRWMRSLLAGIAGMWIGAASVDAQVAAPNPGTAPPATPVAPAAPAPPAAVAALPAPVAASETTIVESAPVAEAGRHPLLFGGDGGAFDFSKTPPVRKLPMLGFAPVPPKGEGYYSVFDLFTDNYRSAPPKFPYPPSAAMAISFFDADFRYLDDPNNTQHDWADALHRIRIGDDFMVSTGGELRWRYMDERNSRLGGTDNDYNLWRTRAYVDAWYRDMFRVYAEFIWADSTDQDLAPLPIDRNRGDVLNAFVDVKLPSCFDGSDYVRLGRQELLLGSERLVSPLDWANTRRTFQGGRYMHNSETFDADLFWVQPVLPNVTRFDSVDNNVNFAGAFFTYRPEKGQAIDLYYFFYDNTNVQTQSGIVRQPSNSHTFGSRYAGAKNQFLWDVEGAVQGGGERGSEDIFAGMFTSGAGYNWECAPMNPTVWLYYDYASGDRSPNANDFTTFNQLYPFGHYYLGWTDLVGRQNINDLNAHLYLYPTKWLTFWTQFHHFWLDSSRDGLYNAAGNIIRRDPTGRAGTDVGNEIDLIANFHLSAHSDFMVGYCRLFSGDFIKATAPTPAAAGDSSLLFAMYSFRW